MANIPFYKDPEFLRPHTALLLMAALLYAVALVSPFHSMAGTVADAGPFQLVFKPLAYGYSGPDSLILPFLWPEGLPGGLMIAGIVLPFMALRQYSSRPRMLRIVRIGLLYAALLALVLVGYSYFNEQALIQEAGATIQTSRYSWAAILPVLTILLFWMAMVSIARDIKRLKKADRFW